MVVVKLRAPLSELAGGREHTVTGDTVRAALAELERQRPAVRGWVTDDRGSIRRHINVFVNGEPAEEETAVTPGDRVYVLPAITGG